MISHKYNFFNHLKLKIIVAFLKKRAKLIYISTEQIYKGSKIIMPQGVVHCVGTV